MHLAEAFMQSDTAFNITFYQLMHSLVIKPFALVLKHNSLFALYLNSDASKFKFVQKLHFRILGLKLKRLTNINEPFETEGLKIFPLLIWYMTFLVLNSLSLFVTSTCYVCTKVFISLYCYNFNAQLGSINYASLNK